VLANAIYFDGSWKSQFDAHDTRKERFYGAGGAHSEVDMMFQNHTFPYVERPNFQMLEMPYAGDDLSMVVILPNERNGLAQLEASISAEDLSATLDDLSTASVDVYLPKFTFNSGFKLGDTLAGMGMTDALMAKSRISAESSTRPSIGSSFKRPFIKRSSTSTRKVRKRPPQPA
jgi:serpin B